jgi:Protein of unknown function (DUF2934)
MATTATREAPKAKSVGKLGPVPIIGIQTSPVELTRQIAEATYFKALARGFEPGHELDDWLAAEDEQWK